MVISELLKPPKSADGSPVIGGMLVAASRPVNSTSHGPPVALELVTTTSPT